MKIEIVFYDLKCDQEMLKSSDIICDFGVNCVFWNGGYCQFVHPIEQGRKCIAFKNRIIMTLHNKIDELEKEIYQLNQDNKKRQHENDDDELLDIIDKFAKYVEEDEN